MLLRKARDVLQDLLDCCELNCDSLEPDTVSSIEHAELLVEELAEYLDSPRVAAAAVRVAADERTAALISCARNGIVVDPPTLLAQLIKAVSDWLMDTDTGRAAWATSDGDFNVGDLAQYEADESLRDRLAGRGIRGFEIQIISVAIRPGNFVWPYDKVLVTTAARKQLDREDERA